MTMTTPTSYSYERLCFDQWAAWCEGRWEPARPQTLMSKIAQYGTRMGVVHAGSEPDINDEYLTVSEIMEDWAVTKRLAHAGLLARHRRILWGQDMRQLLDDKGKPRRFRDRDIALSLLGDGSDAGKKQFQRLCESGYIELRQRLRKTMPSVTAKPA